MTAYFKSVRRYYLLKRLDALTSSDTYDLAITWQAKQEAVSGIDLPSDFPHLSSLQSVGYSTEEDLAGADAAELVENVGLNTAQASAVLTALEEL
jgi:hypothetical protein